MNRDELEAKREDSPTASHLARALTPKVTPRHPSVNLGEILDPQEAANTRISRATMSTRQWTSDTADKAFRAARPIAESTLQSSGRTFGRNDVRALTRTYLAAYVQKYGVLVPPGTHLGGSPLKSTASEICGPLDVPLMFMPPAVQEPIKLATKEGKGWFAKLFSRGPKAAPAAPVAPAAAAPAAAPALASAAPAAAASTAGNVAEILGAAKPPTKKPANADEQKMLAHIVAEARKGNPNAKAAVLRLQQEGYAVSLGSDSGAWMYKLNPLYWFKSSEEQKLIDKEREGWEKNADMQKDIAKRQLVLDQANKAEAAQAAVQAAQTKSAEIATQLKSIETQLAGACHGHELVMDDTTQTAKPVSYKSLISTAKPTDSSGKDKTKAVAKATDADKPNPFTDDDEAPVDAEDAAPVLDRIQKARTLNDNNAADLAAVSKKMSAGKGLTPQETSSVLQFLARNERLHEFRKSLVSGENYAKNPSRTAIQRHVVIGAMKALTPTEQQMMNHMVKLAKQGNPNAQKALTKLRSQGYSTTAGDGIGFGISDAWHIATAPIKYGIVKPLDWTAQKLGITSSPSTSPQQARLQRLKASQARIRAAQAKAAAADAETDAERRVQEQEAAAAAAEADAADAAATAADAKEMTAEQQYMVAPQSSDDDSDDQSGVGKAVITPLPPTPSPKAQLIDARRQIVIKKNPRAARILAASEANTPQGKKLQASMALYTSAKKGNRKDKAAIFALARKAKKGDKQARQDMLALKAAQIAVKANQRASRTLAILATKNAANKKGIAMQKRLEANAAQVLVRRTRAHKLAKVAKIERKAAAGHKPSQAIVKNVVTKAKAGDKNALTAAKALKLAQATRLQTQNAAERKRLKAAHKLVVKAKHGNKKSLAELRVINSAAAHGNPNAKRAQKHLKLAAAAEATLATGAVVLPVGIALSFEEKKRQAAKKKKMAKHVASVQNRIAQKTASREEAMKAASEATALGDKDAAAALSAQAAELPSSQDNLRRVATVAAAAAAGSAVSQDKIAVAQQRAAAGDPSGIAAMGQLAAVKSLDDVRQDRPIDPPMQTAVQDLAKAEEGDEATKAKIAEMQEKAKTGDSNAVKYMTYAAGAAVVARSLANNPAAEEEWQKKAGVRPKDTDNEMVETDRKRVGLPPMPGPEPVKPLEPIQGVAELVAESLKALLFATRDPVQNYKEAVLSRARMLPPLDVTAGDKKEKEPDLSAIDEALSPGLQAAIEARKPKVAVQGANKTFAEYIADARKTKKISQADFDKSMQALYQQVKPENQERKDALRTITLENLRTQGIQVSGMGAAAPKAVKPTAPGVAPAAPAPAAPAAKPAKPAKSSEDEDEDEGDSSGADLTPDQTHLAVQTKSRLLPVKMAAGKGDADAQKKWSTAQANYKKHVADANKGNAKAKNIVAVLNATGLFT